MANEQRNESRLWRMPFSTYPSSGELAVTHCRAGDRLGPRGGSEQSWRGLRHRLAARGLGVVAVGRDFFVAPREAEPQAPLLQELAAGAAAGDRAAHAALKDLTLDLFGDVAG